MFIEFALEDVIFCNNWNQINKKIPWLKTKEISFFVKNQILVILFCFDKDLRKICVTGQSKNKLVFLSFILCKKELVGMILCNNLNWKFWRYEFLQDFFKIIKYFDQFVISQLRSFSYLENWSVGKEVIAFTRSL